MSTNDQKAPTDSDKVTSEHTPSSEEESPSNDARAEHPFPIERSPTTRTVTRTDPYIAKIAK
ncbi:hypothetical protein COB55_05910 [Candidatus Wolfebacteria bacterium]|nr:MAG: hypothetical protein COB55_05910 [Candidatus Wolfebacteria bacterium]